MHCPYCGQFASDQATNCPNCGRDLVSVRRRQTAPQQPRPTSQPQPPYQPPRQAVPSAPPAQNTPNPTPNPRLRTGQPVVTPPPTLAPAPTRPPAAPEPPAPFPPRTLEQLQALGPGALDYTVVSSDVSVGRKKIVRIAYPRCVGWQQMATLLKAFKEQQEAQFESIIVQGVVPEGTSVYNFTNGQLCFNRNVRLGSQTTNRYQVETGTGFENDSVRVVLTE